MVRAMVWGYDQPIPSKDMRSEPSLREISAWEAELRADALHTAWT